MNGITSRCISFAQDSSDCLQRVNYEFGLVLGVDEFVDEQCYFLEKEHQHNRALHGHGTVSGLLVSAVANGDDIEVQVDRGIGIDQYGRVFVVRTTQCASLLSWLADHKLGPGRQAIYVVARYAECETGLVPIAGQPCSTSDQLTAASRLQDVFEIELTLEPPDHRARDAVVNLSEFLSRFRADPAAADLADLGRPGRLVDIIGPLRITDAPTAFRNHVDQVVENVTGVAGAQIIPIQPPAVEAMLNAIFAYWVTEVRPTLRPDLIDPDAPPVAGNPLPPAEILLARIDLVIPDDNALGLDNIAINNTIRPYLLHTQLIQELYDIPDLAGEGGAPSREMHEWASVTDIGPRGLSLWLHIGQDLNLQPNENIRLLRVQPDGNLEQVTIELAEDVPRRNEVGRYYRVRTFVNLNNGDFLLLQFDTNQIQVGGAGTLSDFIANAPFTYPNYLPGRSELFAFHVVDRGQGIDEERIRQLILELMPPQQPVIPFVTVTPLTDDDQAFAYELWFHLDGFAEQNEGLIELLNEENFAMYVEPEPNAVEQIPVELEQLRNNVWLAFPEFGNQPTRSLVRLAFSLDALMRIQAFNPFAGGMEQFETLRQYVDTTRQRLEGQIRNAEQFNGEALIVTVREQGSAGRLPL